MRDKYVRSCHKSNIDLVIWHEGKKMTILAERLPGAIAGRSKVPVADHFSREKHFIVYFDWKPDGTEDPKLPL